MVVFIPLGGSTRLLRTEDYGLTWQQIASGAPNYDGLYIINDWTAYMLTHYFSTSQSIVLLSRGSILPSNQNNSFINDQNFSSDIFVTDTLLNADRCDSSSLSFAIAHNGDTVAYHINFEVLNAGFNENQGASIATIYPNPTTGTFSFDHVTFSDPRSLAIYTATGQLIKVFTKEELCSNQLSVSELAHGTYFVQIDSDQGNELLKLIKQ
jgi:hypothetical protein